MVRERGFTLLELMIVVVIIAVIAAIAIPSFMEQIKKSRRADAYQGLGDLQLQQERWRANHPAYGAAANLNLPVSDYYTFAVTAGSNTGTDAEMTATPKGAQATDRCGTYTLRIDNDDNSPPAGRVDKTAGVANCW